MYPALQIANRIIEKGVESSNLLTHLKLQKTLYLSHGFYLAKTGEALITEYFEAWKLGPVVRSVYDNYKDFGGKPIDRLTPGVNIGNMDQDKEAISVISNAWNIAKGIDAITLSNWTHAPNSPWKKAIDNNDKYISNTELEEYFSKLFKIARVKSGV